jgi:hypothetical protein
MIRFTKVLPQRIRHLPTAVLLTLLLLTALPISLRAQQGSFKVGKLKYGGGGDWYANPSSLPRLFRYIRANTRMNLYVEEDVVDPGSPVIFQYVMLYITGHGNIEFTQAEAQNLRRYLLAGGFLLFDDNYGLHEYAKKAMKTVFPEYDFIELPHSHPIYHQHFKFPQGMPKIHEHDGKPAQGFGIIHEGRLLCLLTYESDLGDGWEEPQVHNNPPEIREKAFQMGTNIVMFIINN